MDWDDLRYFLGIARAGSLSGAAIALGVNHSTVFRRLQGFEARLGVRLFDRLATGYAHMSRIAAASGQRVRRGQVIGYVGSTGLSTGPHLHYELYRNGKTVNPLSVKFTTTAQLAGRELTAFRAKLAAYKGLAVGAHQRFAQGAEQDPAQAAAPVGRGR